MTSQRGCWRLAGSRLGGWRPGGWRSALALAAAATISAAYSGEAAAQNCRWAPQTDGPLELYVCRNADGSLDIVDARPAREGRRAPSPEPEPRLSPEERAARRRAREDNRRIQTVLNAVGCDAGTPDGVVGRRTRAAIDCLRGLSGGGFGDLTAGERDALLTTYETVFDATEDPFAPTEDPTELEVLAIYENGGLRPTSFEVAEADPFGDAEPTPRIDDADGSSSDDPITGVAVGSEADADDDEEPMIGVLFETPPADDASLLGDEDASVAAFCERVRVTRSAEQFCEMRDAFVSDAEQLNATAGRTFEEAAQICADVRDTLTDEIAELGVMSIDDVRARVREQIEYDPDREASFATSMSICVGSGYGVDDGQLALAAALALDALGDPRAPVLIGHHLELGLATRPQTARAEEWLELMEP